MTSSKTKNELRERLLAAQTTDSALRADYERKRNAMFEVRLSRKKKAWLIMLIAFSLAAAITVLTLAVTEKIRPQIRTALVVGVAFALAWTVYFIQLLRRGTFRRRIDAPMAAGMAYVFSVIMCVLMAVGGAPTDKVLLMGMLFLIPAGLILLRTVIEQSEMRMQEQLVEIQYKLARLTQKLGDDDSEDGAGAGVLR